MDMNINFFLQYVFNIHHKHIESKHQIKMFLINF